MNKILVVLIIMLFGGILLFFAKENFVTHQAVPTPVEKLVIGNIGEYSIFNLVAQEKGYFRENGLDITIIEYASGPPAIQDLLAGKLSFAIAADFVGVRTIFTNPDLRIVAHASKHKVFHLVARKDKGIATPIDLKGKTVGVTRTGAGEFYLGRFLLFNNLTFQDIVVRDLTPQEMITQISDGTIDAVVIFDPHAYTLKQQLRDKVISWSVQGEQNIFATLYSTNSYLQTHPETTDRFLRALLQAEQYTAAHPEEIQKFLSKELGYSDEYLTYMSSNFTFAHGLDQELLLTMEDQARWVIDNNLTDQQQVPNYLEYIYFDALEEVNPDAITIIR